MTLTLNSISQFTTEFKGNFEYGILHFQPNISINLVDKLQLLPKYDLRARIFLAKKFKTSETFLNIGVDINYKSKYKLMSFDDRISAETGPPNPHTPSRCYIFKHI